MAAQGRDLDVLDIDAVDKDLALLNVVVPADQAENGGFAGACGAHKGHGLLGVYMEGNTLEHPFSGIVGEPDILELDLALDVAQLDGVGLVHHLGLHVQNGENLLCCGKGLLQHIELLCQGLDGVEEPGDIHIEGDHGLAGNGGSQEGGVPDIALAANIEQEQVGGHEEHIHHGAEDAEDEHPAQLCLFQFLTAVKELRQLPALLVEDLCDLHAGEILGKVGVHIRPGVVDAAVDVPGELLEDDGEEHQKGHKAQHHQRQRIVQDQHGTQHTQNHQGVLDQGDQNIGEQIADGIGVVGDSRHQLAHGNLIQLGVGQLLNVGKGIHAQLGQDFLADLLEDHSLEVGADHAHSQNACIDGHQGKQSAELEALLNGALNGGNQQGRHHIVGDGDQHDKENQCELLLIGRSVAQQPTDDLAVGHMPFAGFLGGLLFQYGIGAQKDQGKYPDNGTGNDEWQIFTHFAPLLPLPGAADLPFCGIPHWFHRACRGFRSLQDGRRQ